MTDSMDPLSRLRVIDRFEVGPLRLEKRRLTVSYSVTRKGRLDTQDLIYKFEEDVFDPDDPDSLNLASMISVQVAMNYGLFCEEMVFKGLFDDRDRRFIRSMMENTGREIFVKKFMEPNPFLQGPISNLPFVKPDTYLAARLTFENTGTGVKNPTDWNWNPDRYAVLSSGGKDSLLTFGLLKEMGCEVHPIFINESGRHWFTALNAYRDFVTDIPFTSRVWTNSDRIFNWMLRHLPFIRDDFAQIRSDQYPVRLWTVAVFIFGALPVLRKRGIGRLLIGDEHDTTEKRSFKGIPHFDGVYDQSRYFDNAMTRYFYGKGWGIAQFSVLRPLSELLIEKILVERYPKLQSNQVSCHATHQEGERIRPCGRCEKCRRIVGMLMALDADPKKCGYTQEQIDRCLDDLQLNDIHQGTREAEHLAFLLGERRLIERSSIGSVRGRQRPEIMKLRFDTERSRMEEIPVELREPLYRLCLKHGDGAVKKVNHEWVDFDLLNNADIRAPYTFAQTPRVHDERTDKMKQRNKSAILGELTWPEAQKRFEQVDVALLPVGSIEQHGPHLPLDTDAFDAAYLARQVAFACSNPKPLVLPLVPYGVSYHHDDFPGTISISPNTLSNLVYEIGMSAAKNGIKKLVIVNGHGGNSPALHFAAQLINRDAHIFTCVDTGETSDPDIFAIAETPNDVHAGEIETSTSLALRPELVRFGDGSKFIPEFSSRYLNFSSRRSVGWYARISKMSPTGVLGDPTKATPEKGRQMWEMMIKHLKDFVEDLKNLTLEEIYERRY